jgi:hypothetical protein
MACPGLHEQTTTVQGTRMHWSVEGGEVVGRDTAAVGDCRVVGKRAGAFGTGGVQSVVEEYERV